MRKILIGFLPWILYFILIGTTQTRIDLAVVVAFIALFITGLAELKKGFILTWGTVIYFGIMLILVVFFQNQWMMRHAWLLSNTMLAGIAWYSLIVKKPFTLQYAREQVDESRWQHPIFIKINVILTTSWAVIFSLCALIHLIQLSVSNPTAGVYQTLTNGLSILGIIITMKFPDYYRDYLRNKLKAKTAKNKFLQGNFKPVRDELDVDDLKVIGEIPKDLNGSYMRNGPNPAFDPISYTYPFDGDGMIHAVDIKDGKARYRNRFVQTQALTVEQRAGQAVYGGIMHPFAPDEKYFIEGETSEKFKNGAFINIIQQQDKLIALHEGESAYEMDFSLNTKGKWQAGTDKAIRIGPHPRLDPLTGERWFINYDITPPFLELYCIGADGAVKKHYPIETQYPVMLHDFVLTKNYAICLLCPVVLDIEGATSGGNLLAWKPELGTPICIISRETGQVQWMHTEAFFVFHYANAYEKDNQIIIDSACRSNFMFGSSDKEKTKFSLRRTTLDLAKQTVVHDDVDSGTVIEFPRIREDLNSLENRYIYICAKHDSEAFNSLIKYDMQHRNSTKHDFGQDKEIGEAVFVPREGGIDEDDGYAMLFVYDKPSNSSEFVILDAKHIDAEPLARIQMPRRVPAGLHGNWMEF